MDTATLPLRQAQVLGFVQNEIATKALPPTRKEIAIHFGFRSVNAAEDHLRALARKGFLELIPSTGRGIRLISTTTPSIQHNIIKHSSAPSDCKCADCTVYEDACPACYGVWWHKRYPNSHSL